MRIWIVSLTLVALSAGTASAQTQGQPSANAGRLEASLSAHGLRREDASKTWPGGGFGLAWNAERLAIAAEGTITRRDGHNDWHALAGPRVALVTTPRTRLFVQLLAGTIIRQKEARASGLLGAGLDVSLGTRAWMRVQAAGLLDKAEADSLTSGRISIGFVLR